MSPAPVRVAAVRDRPSAEALDLILSEVGRRTRLIALSHVLWINGHVIPIAELKEVVPVPLLVDGAQSVGTIPVDAEPFDFYTVSGQKWLCGPTPTGGLYIRDPEALRVAGPSYFSQSSYETDGSFQPRDGARRFDQSWVPAAFIVGPKPLSAWHRTGGSTDHGRRPRGVASSCWRRATRSSRSRDTRSLVSWRREGDTMETVKQLGEEGVIIRELPGGPACCVHPEGYWTSEDDIDRLIEALA